MILQELNMPFALKRIPILITLLFIHFSSLFAQHETEYVLHRGYELHFDGDDDYVNINTVADDMNGLTDWAFSLWVKPQKDLFQATNVYYLAINCENGNANCNRILFGIRTEDGKPFIWERPDGGGSEGFVLTSETAINDGKWNHIAYSNSTSTGTLYLNGVSVGTHTVKHAAFKSDDRWSLGQEFDGNSITNEYVGSIDDVAVYNRAKSSEYFADIYNSGIGNIANHASANGLTSYWKIDEGKGTTIGDQMSAGNTGTIVGATWKTTRAKTIDNLKVTEFDVYRDRLYAVHPGTNDASDSAAVVSIVDIRTDSVIAQGGEFSTTKPGFHGYPNKIAVFNHIGIVGEDLKMFDFRQDSVKFMCRNLYSTEADCDSYNYLSHNALHMQKHRDHLYIALHSYGFAVFDMSDPLRPVKVHEKDYGLENDYPYGIHANDTHIFVADIDTDGGKVYIHKNGGDFEKIGEVNTKAYRLATHGNFLYTDQKKVFDISDPTSPQELTNHNYTGSSSNGEMSVYGDYLLIAAGGYKDSANPRASIYNIKDPTDIKLAYTFDDTLPSYDIKISGKKLFVAFEAQGTDVGGIKVFENQFSPIRHLFVSPDGSNTSGSGSHHLPYKTIGYALHKLPDNGGTISVSAGTYEENIDLAEYDPNDIAEGYNNVSIIGENKNTTIIKGNGNNSVLTIANSTNLRIRNFSIIDGKSEKGGGIFIDSSKVFLTNVNIENNKSEGQGGGLYISSSEVTLRDVKVDKNHADGDGGGLYIYSNSDVDFDNSIVSNNSCGDDGGGMKIHNSCTVTFTRSELTTNTSTDKGGGIVANNYSKLKFNRSSVSNNSGTYGAAFRLRTGTVLDLSQSTVFGNTAENAGNAVYAATSCSLNVSRSVIADNGIDSTISNIYLTDGYLSEIENSILRNANSIEIGDDDSGVLNVVYSNIKGGWEGTGNIDTDPQFCDSTSFLYYDTSPCVNAGKDGYNIGAGIGCDLPKPFFWNTAQSETINITKDNLTSTYDLDWTESIDNYGDPILYTIHAKIGAYESEDIDDTTGTTYPILYEDILEGAFENVIGNAATVRFTVWAHDGTDSVKISRDDRVLYVNRYDYLSTESEGIPTEFALHENYPNPFNPSTQIRFDLPEMANVNLVIYNMLGQKIKSFNMQSAPAGYHAVTWNATNALGAQVSAGVYLYQLQTEGFIKTKKMILLK